MEEGLSQFQIFVWHGGRGVAESDFTEIVHFVSRIVNESIDLCVAKKYFIGMVGRLW